MDTLGSVLGDNGSDKQGVFRQPQSISVDFKPVRLLPDVELRRNLWYYFKVTRRSNMGSEHVNRYPQIRHGCRDERPQHWRRYL